MVKLQNENPTAPFVLLNNGKPIPAIGLGTYEVKIFKILFQAEALATKQNIFR